MVYELDPKKKIVVSVSPKWMLETQWNYFNVKDTKAINVVLMLTITTVKTRIIFVLIDAMMLKNDFITY